MRTTELVPVAIRVTIHLQYTSVFVRSDSEFAALASPDGRKVVEDLSIVAGEVFEPGSGTCTAHVLDTAIVLDNNLFLFVTPEILVALVLVALYR